MIRAVALGVGLAVGLGVGVDAAVGRAVGVHGSDEVGATVGTDDAVADDAVTGGEGVPSGGRMVSVGAGEHGLGDAGVWVRGVVPLQATRAATRTTAAPVASGRRVDIE